MSIKSETGYNYRFYRWRIAGGYPERIIESTTIHTNNPSQEEFGNTWEHVRWGLYQYPFTIEEMRMLRWLFKETRGERTLDTQLRQRRLGDIVWNKLGERTDSN